MRRIVVKVGTSTLTEGAKKLSPSVMHELARQLVLLQKEGHEVILVSSGAIAAGRERLFHPPADKALPMKQMFASVGQVELMHRWSEIFATFSTAVGQVLLTRDDLSHRRRYLNARDTLFCLLDHKIVPIINENDTVATREIRVGDNDNLAAYVANLIAADLLILLTDQEGLFTADPRRDPNAKLIPIVEKIDASIVEMAGGSGTTLGTGGMSTKIEAASVASQSGTETIITTLKHPDVLLEIGKSKQVGTRFITSTTPKESRKRWLLSERKQGTIQVDQGAAEKIKEKGASLLPSGIVLTEKSFERGAVVQIVDIRGKPIGVGITHYGSQEIEQIKRHQSKEIESILGYSYGTEVIHRNNMVCFL